MADLDVRLTELGRELEWPPTPQLRLRPVPARRRFRRRTLVLAFGLALLLAAAAVAAIVGLDLNGATVERRPGPLPKVHVTPLNLGPVAKLSDAPFTPLVPTRAGRPDEVHLREGIELLLAYKPAPGRPRAKTTGLGLLVSEFPGQVLTEYIGKIAGQATKVEKLRIDSHRAIWIHGAPHLFFYRSPTRPFQERELHLAANVLLVERGELLVRLEGAFDRAEAIALERSLQPGTE